MSLRTLTYSLLILSVCAGCGPEEPEPAVLVPAQGIVKIDGEPADGIFVQFYPKASQFEGQNVEVPNSSATTDEDGVFVLKTPDGRSGAVAGEGTITLSDAKAGRTPQGEPETPARLPDSYAVLTKSNLKFTADESGKSMEIDVRGNRTTSTARRDD